MHPGARIRRQRASAATEKTLRGPRARYERQVRHRGGHQKLEGRPLASPEPALTNPQLHQPRDPVLDDHPLSILLAEVRRLLQRPRRFQHSHPAPRSPSCPVPPASSDPSDTPAPTPGSAGRSIALPRGSPAAPGTAAACSSRRAAPRSRSPTPPSSADRNPPAASPPRPTPGQGSAAAAPPPTGSAARSADRCPDSRTPRTRRRERAPGPAAPGTRRSSPSPRSPDTVCPPQTSSPAASAPPSSAHPDLPDDAHRSIPPRL